MDNPCIGCHDNHDRCRVCGRLKRYYQHHLKQERDDYKCALELACKEIEKEIKKHSYVSDKDYVNNWQKYFLLEARKDGE